MHPALWISVTGLEAQNTDIRVISNNLANVSTTGYKKSRAFSSFISPTSARSPTYKPEEDSPQ